MIVYYSLAYSPVHANQWVSSIRSLRKYNKTIEVHLFYYDGLPNHTLAFAEQYNVIVHDCGRYHDKYPNIEGYNVLHRFGHPLDTNRALYVDCDTYFFGDVAQLFKYMIANIYAREEVFTRASSYGYNKNWIDEDILFSIAGKHLTPINLGVVLMNNYQQIVKHESDFLNYVLDIKYGKLPNPCGLDWIIDEIAMILLANKLGLTVDLFSNQDVTQGIELPNKKSIVAHYWTNNEKNFFSVLK